MAQSVAQTIVVKINKYLFSWGKSSSKILATYANFQKVSQRKLSPNRRKIAQSGYTDINNRRTIFTVNVSKCLSPP
jgi:hypothetical protein